MSKTRFHFVVDNELFIDLFVNSSLKKQSVSDFICKILEETYSNIENSDCTLFERTTAYLSKASNKKKNDIFIQLPIKFKKKLSAIQEHFDLRSKAEILRFIISEYIALHKKYKRNVIEKFFRIFQLRWEREKLNTDAWRAAHMSSHTDYFISYYNKDNQLLKKVILPK